nr:hypothetical protein [Arthrobacter agilis]
MARGADAVPPEPRPVRLGQRAVEHAAPVRECEDARTPRSGARQQRCAHDDAGTVPAQVLQGGRHVLRGVVVEPLERLVEDQDARPLDHGRGDDGALQLAPGEPSRVAVQQVRQREIGGHAVHEPLQPVGGNTAVGGAEGDLLPDRRGHHGQLAPRTLRHVGHLPAPRGGVDPGVGWRAVEGHGLAVEGDRAPERGPGVSPGLPGQEPGERRLAGAGGTGDDHVLPRPDRQGDAREERHAAVVREGSTLERDHGATRSQTAEKAPTAATMPRRARRCPRESVSGR